MEKMSTAIPETSDTASQVIQDCLRTPVILRQVLEQFTNIELLQLSLVNKQWNFEARSVLKARGNLLARIRSHDICRRLAAFASDLEQIRVVPFSGIEVDLWHSSACQSLCKESLHPSFNVILERLPWKHLDVNFTPNWRNNLNCPAIALVKKILDGFSGVIEKLSLYLLEDTVNWFQIHLKNWSFSHLKTLVLHANGTEDSFGNFVKALVASAPHLQELHFGGRLDLKENVLDGSSAVLVPDFEFNPLNRSVCKRLIGALRPEVIEMYPDETENLDLELLNGFVPKVLQASRTSLKTLRMDLLIALPLFCYGICLENVTTLEIRVSGILLKCLQQPILAILKAFDFTRVFPKLNQVRILNEAEADNLFAAFENLNVRSFSPDDFSTFVEQGSAVLKNILPDRAINIKQLTLSGSVWESSVQFWAHMFPHVGKLSVTTDGTSGSPFADILEFFVNLVELNVTVDQRRPLMIVNLDSAFCGIFPVEVYELRGMNDEYLKAVNIVPVKPSISCLKELKSFTCRYTPEDSWLPGEDSTFMFTKVSALLGFAKCPSLDVTFVTNSATAEALKQMEPYVTFIVRDQRV